MGQKKINRTKAWQRDQIDAEWRRRTEKALADIKTKNEAKVAVAGITQHDEMDGYHLGCMCDHCQSTTMRDREETKNEELNKEEEE